MLLSKYDILPGQVPLFDCVGRHSFLLSCLKHSEILKFYRALSCVRWFKVTQDSWISPSPSSGSDAKLTNHPIISNVGHILMIWAEIIAETSSFLMN
jgi:hypothetical protein